MKVTVFGMENCAGCVTVKRLLDERGVTYDERDVMNPDHMAEASSLGVRGVPTVVIENNSSKVVLVGSERKTLAEIQKAVGIE